MPLGSEKDISGHSENEDRLLEVAKEAFMPSCDFNATTGSYEPLAVKDLLLRSRKAIQRSGQRFRDHVNRLVEEGFSESVETYKFSHALHIAKSEMRDVLCQVSSIAIS